MFEIDYSHAVLISYYSIMFCSINCRISTVISNFRMDSLEKSLPFPNFLFKWITLSSTSLV